MMTTTISELAMPTISVDRIGYATSSPALDVVFI